MLKYIKRRRVDEEDNENESKLSEPSTSKAEKVTDKKLALTTTVTWPWVLHGLETKIARSTVHCLREKLSNTAVVPAKLRRHFTTNHSHLSSKKMITLNDFWIHKTNNAKFLRIK
jgi:hypothetical protein